jgi:hypothetical protein
MPRRFIHLHAPDVASMPFGTGRADLTCKRVEKPQWVVRAADPDKGSGKREEISSAELPPFHKGGNMNKRVLSLVGVLSLLLVAGSAVAQNTILADVPFNFTVNRTMMPAGQYSVSNVGAGDTLLIQSQDKKTVKLVTPNRAEISTPSRSTKLVFHCYGKEQCFLYQIWTEGKSRGRELPKSSIENEVAASLRSNDVPVIASAR